MPAKPKAKKAKANSVAERIAERLFERHPRLHSEPTHLEIVAYPGTVQHGRWTKDGVIQIINAELKKARKP